MVYIYLHESEAIVSTLTLFVTFYSKRKGAPAFVQPGDIEGGRSWRAPC